MILGFLAVVLGTLNVVGGFVVTDRMLEMFSRKK
jgi:NAD(P) transhydrogenase subunit alpha